MSLEHFLKLTLGALLLNICLLQNDDDMLLWWMCVRPSKVSKNFLTSVVHTQLSLGILPRLSETLQGGWSRERTCGDQ